MKRIIAVSAATVASLIGSVLWYHWDSNSNHGFHFGYYGEFNRFSNALATIPGITVTQAWANCDVMLEEFGFSATLRSGEPIHIAFGERDPIRSLSGDALVLALKKEIESQTKK